MASLHKLITSDSDCTLYGRSFVGHFVAYYFVQLLRLLGYIIFCTHTDIYFTDKWLVSVPSTATLALSLYSCTVEYNANATWLPKPAANRRAYRNA